MSEFIIEYWQFFVAGLILVALIAYWITDRVLAKKAKAKELEQMEAMLEETSEEKQPKTKGTKKQTKEPALEEAETNKEEELEVSEEPQETEDQPEAPAKKAGIYTISYDKEKKDWVVKRRGNKRATKRTRTKKEALEVVKGLTESQDVGYVVKKKDGKFQKK